MKALPRRLWLTGEGLLIAATIISLWEGQIALGMLDGMALAFLAASTSFARVVPPTLSS